MIELTLNKRRLVVIDDNKNKILDDENSEYRENNCDNQSVRESITRLRFDLAEEEWFESTEEQKINLKKNNSSKHLPIDFSSQTPEMQKNIWDNCVSNFDFKEFRNKLTLAEISIKELASKLEEFISSDIFFFFLSLECIDLFIEFFFTFYKFLFFYSSLI